MRVCALGFFVIFICLRTKIGRFYSHSIQIFIAFVVIVTSLSLSRPLEFCFTFVFFNRSIYLLAIAFLSHYDLYLIFGRVLSGIWTLWTDTFILSIKMKAEPKPIQLLGSCLNKVCVTYRHTRAHTHQNVHEIRWIGTNTRQMMLRLQKNHTPKQCAH